MSTTQRMPRPLRWTVWGIGAIIAGYAGLVTLGWYRYGRATPPVGHEVDPLLDRFMPNYDIVERHFVRVSASPEVTLRAAADVNLQRSPLLRAIFRTRELVLGTTPDTVARPKGLLAEVQSMGWRILAETPGREVVVGAVTQPWNANVVFRGLSPDEFAAFREPGYVKIVWTLRADPADDGRSIFRTETRAVATDADARRRFHWYWARFSPGIIVIRRVLLRQLKAAAERV